MGRDQQRLGLADGTTGAVLGSATYARLTTVAVVTLPPRAAPGASPAESPQPEPTTSVPQAPQAATDAWMHFQSDTGDYIGGGKQQVWTLKESDFSVGGNNRDIRTSVSGQGGLVVSGISRSKQWASLAPASSPMPKERHS